MPGFCVCSYTLAMRWYSCEPIGLALQAPLRGLRWDLRRVRVMCTLSSWLINRYGMKPEHVQELSRHQYLGSIAALEIHARIFHSWRPAAVHTFLLHPPEMDGNGFMLSLKLAASIISGPDGAHVGVRSDPGRTVIVSNPGDTFLH